MTSKMIINGLVDMDMNYFFMVNAMQIIQDLMD